MTPSLLTQIPLPPTPASLIQKLPALAVRSATLVPFGLQQAVLVRVLRQIFSEALADGDFDFLQDRCLKVNIKDARASWYFSFNKGDILIQQHAQEDASISGNLKEFLLLASRKEDPDTLFFQRRLLIEGDTEIGLEIKNVMDAIELESMPQVLRTALDKATSLVCYLEAQQHRQ